MLGPLCPADRDILKTCLWEEIPIFERSPPVQDFWPYFPTIKVTGFNFKLQNLGGSEMKFRL